MFQLVSLWSQYVEIIYMPESEVHVMAAIEKIDARPEDMSYDFRTQDQETKSRISTLFAKDDTQAAVQRKEEDYETVNEGMTTDTTEAPVRETRQGVEEAASETAAAKEQEGIQSSDEE